MVARDAHPAVVSAGLDPGCSTAQPGPPSTWFAAHADRPTIQALSSKFHRRWIDIGAVARQIRLVARDREVFECGSDASLPPDRVPEEP
jgi:hypothetical protein